MRLPLLSGENPESPLYLAKIVALGIKKLDPSEDVLAMARANRPLKFKFDLSIES